MNRPASGGFDYQSGLGDIDVFNNLILGKWGGKVGLRKGWQLGVGETLWVRGGSFVDTRLLDYKTSGYSLQMSGLFNLLEAVSPTSLTDTWLGFIRDHFNLQFHSSSYGESSSPVSGTSFKGLNLVIR